MSQEDDELTRKAIEEILREAKEHKERDEAYPTERKVNPLGKANKQFLGRTINAAVRHNERTDEQNWKRCRKKLNELDKHHSRPKSRSRSRSSSLSKASQNKHYRVTKRREARDRSSSSNDSLDRDSKKHKKSKRKKKHKRKKNHRGESSSGSSSSSNSRKSGLKIDLSHGSTNRDQEESGWPNHWQQGLEIDMQNYAACMMQPIYWTASMQQLYQWKALMDISATGAQANTTENVQIEQLSVSSSSLSDVNFDEVIESKPSNLLPSTNSMLTINVSSEDEGDSCEVATKMKESSEEGSVENDCIEVVDSDCDSDVSKITNPIINLNDSDEEENPESRTGEILVTDSHSDNGSEEGVISLKSTDSNDAVDLTEE